MKEFGIRVGGVCFVLSLAGKSDTVPGITSSLMILDELKEGEPICVRPADWI